MSKQAPPGTQSVLRAVRLLKALTQSSRDMDLAELTEQAGLARTTTHRLLSALESEGLVARNSATAAYRLGPAAIAMGTRALRSSDLRRIVHPYLEDLAARTGETATLEVLADGEMLILDEALGRHLVGAQPSLGTAWAVHATSSGKALLAAMGASERSTALRGRLRKLTPQTVVRKRELMEELDRIQQRGWATSRQELETGFDAVAAVVHDALGQPAAAISLNVPSARASTVRIRELGELLARTATTISHALGGPASAEPG